MEHTELEGVSAGAIEHEREVKNAIDQHPFVEQ